jgi:undecaprenyl-diphosphatase
MNIQQALSLGILQGLTEFLPISSSGHLVLAQHLLGLHKSQLFFDVAVHVGTLMAVFLVFRTDLHEMLKDCLTFLKGVRPSSTSDDTAALGDGAKMFLLILVGSVPAALIGLLFRDVVEWLFTSPLVVGLGLWTTGLILFWSRWSRERFKDLRTPRVSQALLVGLAQGAAISPGLSRSGMTITTALLLGLRPELAFRFSFLLSIPAILGALVLEVHQSGTAHPGWLVLAAGFFSAFLVGWAALRALQALVGRGKLFYFAPYCFLVGTFAFIIAF